MHTDYLKGVNTRIFLIDCDIKDGRVCAGAAYLPAWLKEKETITDGTITYVVKVPDSLSNQYSSASCVDLTLELG